MSSANKALLFGRLGNDPEIRYTGDSRPITTFSIATNKRWTGKDGEKKEKTTWHRIVCFSKLAEICARNLAKGSTVFLEGEIEYRQYEDRDGNQRNITENVAREVQFVNDGREHKKATDGVPNDGAPGYDEPGSDHDLF